MLLHPEMVPPEDLTDPDDPRHDKYRTEMGMK